MDLPNQSLDTSQLDPNMQALLGQIAGGGQQSSAPPAPSNPSPAAPAAPAPSTSTVSYIRPRMQSDNPLIRLLSRMTGKDPIGGPAIAAIDSDPTAEASKAMGLAPLSPIGTGTSGKPMYDYEGVQKRGGQIATLKMLSQRMGNAHPPVSPEMANAIATGDQGQVNTIWQNHLTEAGLDPNTPLPQQFVTMTNAAKGTNAKSSFGDSMRGRVLNQQAAQAEAMGQSLAGLKTNGDFDVQNKRTSASFHAWQILEQGYDPKTGEFNVSPTRFNELAQTAATMATGSTQLSNERVDQIRQSTLKGDLGSALTYATGDNSFNGNTQSVLKQLGSMILRQGLTAQGLRDNYMKSAAGANIALKQINPQMYDATINETLGSAPDFAGYVQRSPMGAQFKSDTQGLQANPITGNRTPTNAPPVKKVDMTGMVKMTDPKGGVHAVPAGKIIKYRASPYNWTPQ